MLKRNSDQRSASGIGAALLGAGLVIAVCGCYREGPQVAIPDPDSVLQAVSPLSEDATARIETFCSDCHALPRPESFSRDRWHAEVLKGYEFYAKSGRSDLDPPLLYETLNYYRSRAPDAPTYREPVQAIDDPPTTFTQQIFRLDAVPGIQPEISHLAWTRLSDDENPVMLACDMRHGHILSIDLQGDERQIPRVLAQLRNPARVQVVDLDGLGADDLLVADLGSYLPSDHDRGRVVLLQRRSGTEAYDEVELATGLGRVADVRVADVNSDRKPDLIIAEFGWHETGGLWWFRNESRPDEPLIFAGERIDDRPGAIHVPAHDFNEDGRPDLLALVSQEHESVDIFLNADEGRFARVNLWTAPDLTFGSSGIELVDLDQDGDSDILYTNGDAFDNAYVSPWHGVQWLENRGGLEFTYRRLTDLPGAYRALAGDLDGDGDSDVVAVSWLPHNAEPRSVSVSTAAAIVMLEQTSPGKFVRHTLETGWPVYATLALGDFDGDRDLDFAVAPGPSLSSARQPLTGLRIWWNQLIPANEE